MASLIIRNARIAGKDGTVTEGDVLCVGHLIEKIQASIDAQADEEIDAKGKLLMPGVIDAQVHFREPGMEYKEGLASGSRAAVKGGVTSFLEMPNTRPNTIDQAALDDKLARAAAKSVANYGFFIGATPDNLEQLNSVSPTCGIKIFMGASTGDLLVDKEADLERIFANGDRLIAVHAENEQCIQEHRQRLSGRTDYAAHSEIRARECAVLATEMALRLSKKYQRRLHILHLSTADEVDILREDKPAWVTCEAIPNHLLLNKSYYAELGARVQQNPPVRDEHDNQVLWQGLLDGIIDIVATDHAPHTLEEKQLPYPKSPSGTPCVELSLPLMLTEMQKGRCELKHIMKWMCYGPAETYGIPNKGVIEEGRDADLTLVDLANTHPVRDEELFTKVRWSPYVGRELTGWPTYTIVNGAVAFANGSIRETTRGRALTFD